MLVLITGVPNNTVQPPLSSIGGLRLALGATPQHIGWLVLRQGMSSIMAGLAIGLAVSLGVGALHPLFSVWREFLRSLDICRGGRPAPRGRVGCLLLPRATGNQNGPFTRITL